MNKAREIKNYVVESENDMVPFTLERGDTVYNMADSITYTHVSRFTPFNYTLKQLNDSSLVPVTTAKAAKVTNAADEAEVKVEEVKVQTKTKSKTKKDA